MSCSAREGLTGICICPESQGQNDNDPTCSSQSAGLLVELCWKKCHCPCYSPVAARGAFLKMTGVLALRQGTLSDLYACGADKLQIQLQDQITVEMVVNP